LNAAIERAKAFSTDKIRVFAFTHQSAGEKKDYARIYELVREAAQRTRKSGLRLALENVGGSYVSTGAQAADLLKNVKMRTIWTHSGIPTMPPLPANNLSRTVYRLWTRPASSTYTCATSPSAQREKLEWTAVGEGEFDNLGQIRALRKDGYKENVYAGKRNWRSPKGKAHATATSLKGLLQVIDRV